MDILCLFDHSGIAGQMWADNGYNVTCIDLKNDNTKRNNITYLNMNLFNKYTLIKKLDKHPPRLILTFPDCTHLAVSGARWIEEKKRKDPLIQVKAIKLFRLGEDLAKRYNIPCFTENPVSMAASLYRKPDAYFHPYEYGGYLPKKDINPFYPEYIKPRDAYPKKTGAWMLNGFTLPPKRPVNIRKGYSNQYKKLGGSSERTKEIRSLSPRGFFIAVYEHMKTRI